MNKASIKSFSIWARNKLIDDIRYRAGLLGITEGGIQSALPQSTKETEFYDIGTAEPYAISGEAVSQRRRLAAAIREKERKSGYQTAYQYIVEEVAYTWFNRLIAIRFMEVNDYLPSHLRVLSSDSGKLEPDLVTTPFDAELAFSAGEEQLVLQLKQENRIDELFQLLFIKQCNALNEILPGLFEKTNDYTELLLSVSVVDRDGVVYRLTHDIQEDDFNIEMGGQVEIIGWLYQYWNTEPKDAVFGRPSGQKIKKEEIPAATQLFTPDWIVRYMVENSLGRLWVEGHPDGGLKSNWKYYIEEAEQEPDVQAQLAEIRRGYATLTPEEIRCIDPCMGSGHILCYLFDVLMQIYESQGYSRRDAAQSIVRFNLYGLDIDKRATQLAYFSVMMKARQYDRRFFSRNLQPMVYCTAWDEEGENFGSLVMVDDPGERPEDPQSISEIVDYEKRLNIWSYRYLLAQKYHVVVTNPPYMGGAGMNEKLTEFVKKNYSDSKSDLSTAFMEKTLQLCNLNGFMAMINIPVWMFLSSYEKMRQKLLSQNTISSMVHPGRGIFGSDFGTTTFVIAKKHINNYFGIYRRLFERQGEVESVEERKKAFFSGKGVFVAQQDKFSQIPGSPVAYWVSNTFISLFGERKIVDYAEPRHGMSTGNNDLCLRLWHEVSYNDICFSADSIQSFDKSGCRYAPYKKGGEFRLWYGNNDYVIAYCPSARTIMEALSGYRASSNSFFFRPSINWSDVSSSYFGVRISSKGFAFDGRGASMFCNDDIQLYLLGLLASKITSYTLNVLNPTLTFNINNIEAIPVIVAENGKVENIVLMCIREAKNDWDSFETSWDFKRNPMV